MINMKYGGNMKIYDKKHIVRGREQFAAYKKYLDFLARFVRLFSIRMRKKMLEGFRNAQGQTGLGIRYVLLKSIAEKCGDFLRL